MSEQDFYEVEPTRTNAGGSEETNEEELSRSAIFATGRKESRGK